MRYVIAKFQCKKPDQPCIIVCCRYVPCGRTQWCIYWHLRGSGNEGQGQGLPRQGYVPLHSFKYVELSYGQIKQATQID